MKKERFIGIDILKLICAFLVVCIHKPLVGYSGEFIGIIARIAVPIFFMVTGYFYRETNDYKQIKKALKLILKSNLIYFIWNIIKNYIENYSLSEYIIECFSLKNIFKFIVFNESLFASHLWYLGALLYVLLIIKFLENKKISLKRLFPLIPILILLDLVLGKYSLLIFNRKISHILIRNFLFVGMPNFLIGKLIFEKQKEWEKILNKKIIIILIVVLTFTSVMERNILEMINKNAVREFYISTTGLAIFVFIFFLKYILKNKTTIKISDISEKNSTNIYIYHFLIIEILNMILKNVYLYNIIAPIIVFIIPIIINSIIEIIKNIVKEKIKLKKDVKN